MFILVSTECCYTFWSDNIPLLLKLESNDKNCISKNNFEQSSVKTKLSFE